MGTSLSGMGPVNLGGRGAKKQRFLMCWALGGPLRAQESQHYPPTSLSVERMRLMNLAYPPTYFQYSWGSEF